MTENLKREEARRRADLLKLESYRIDLDVSEAPAETEFFDVTSVVTLTAQENADTFLDFIGKSVSEVRIDGKPVDFRFDGARVHVHIPAGEHEVTVRAKGMYSRTGEGLHRFRDPVDGETYLYSQFEPADARRVFPNFEQPNLKASFAISITGPAAWEILSNGKEQAREDASENSLGQQLARVTFAPTKPMSTYLTAFIGGPYHRFSDAVDVDGQTIELGFYCRDSLAEHFEIDDISTVTKQGLQLMPKVFDYPYVWGKYDSAFVPEYNLGAMENPGCVTFSEDAYVYRGEATRAQRAARANTIMHEMSHMWFGDLVTPVWWDDLWLKESFAEFLGAWASATATKYTEAWENFAGARLSWALRNDQYPTTHPIIADIPDLEAADQAFDGITYAKGAAVLRQLVAFTGEDAFFVGAARLFKTHAFGNATLADLMAALEEASGKDLGDWVDQWLRTAGVSTVTVERTSDGVRLSQQGIEPLSGEPIVRPHKLRVSGWKIVDADGGAKLTKAGDTDVELRTQVTVPWQEIGGDDVDLILPNDSALSYVKIGFDETSLKSALAYEVDEPLARSVISTALWEMVRDADLPASRYAEFVSHSGEDTSSGLLAARINNALLGLSRYTHVSVREAELTTFFDGAVQKRGQGSSDAKLLWSRALARVGAALPTRADVVAEMLADTTDQDLRWQLLTALAATGNVTAAELDAELARTGSAADVVAHVQARFSMEGKAAEGLAKLASGTLSNDHVSAIINGLRQPLREDELRAELGDYFGHVTEIWRKHSQEIAERIIYGLYPMTDLKPGEAITDKPEVRAAEHWLDTATAPAALVKIVTDCHDDQLRALHAQELSN
ncbi:aminopeptidase N [Trueperella bialowiezensis]|uniref:aminopeptidase N n=1 Tax=Trueperella bialowiezensis TaxID=312285 RepID=UPI0013E060D1|nr:aminopeptidase N [Trueperella bialowiezensis]